MWMFEALFNGSSPKLSTHALEKCFEHQDFILCSSFQNLRLGQPSATSPLFFDNLHFEHFDKSVNLDSWLTFLPHPNEEMMISKHFSRA
jgi:hypothetical protein